MSQSFGVYILYSQSADQYYIGHTNDIERRLSEHNDPLANSSKFCVKNGPWKLVYIENDFLDRSAAMMAVSPAEEWSDLRYEALHGCK